MASLLTVFGEEYVMKNGFDGVTTFQVGVYNDSTDAITDGEDIVDITTEPSDTGQGSSTAYARQTNGQFDAFAGTGTVWGTENSAQFQFDLSDVTSGGPHNIDSWFLVVNFISAEAGETTVPSDHLIATGALSQTRDIDSIDTLNIAAGAGDGTSGVGFTLE